MKSISFIAFPTVPPASPPIFHLDRSGSATSVAEEEFPSAAALLSANQAAVAWSEDTEEFLVRWHPDGTRVWVNQAYCRRYGCEPKDLVGKNLRAQLDTESQIALNDKISALSPTRPTWTEQRNVITPNGINSWQEWVTRGFFDEDGQLIELQSLGRDVTLQKDLSLAMDEIARSLLTLRGTRYFEQTVRHLARVLQADACYAGEIIYTPAGNPCFHFLGLAVDDVLEYLPDIPLAGTPLEFVLKDGFISVGNEARLRFPEAPLLGRIRAQSFVAAAMRDHDGTVLGAVGVLFRKPMAETNFYKSAVIRLTAAVGASRLLQSREIRRRESVEKQLRESQKMEAVGQLAGGIAHDFNNLLTVLSGHAALLQSLNLPADAAESVREISAGTQRAATLTRQLLMFSRRQVMQFAVHDLNEIVRGFSRFLQRLTPAHIHLTLDLHPDPLLVEADPGMIEQVILNLAVNARDAMPTGGHLTLTTRPQQALPETALTALPMARLTVTDTGCGIPPEHLNRIFEPFFTTKPPGEGTGIGLATVYSIAGQHQGHLKAESNPGSGTRIHLHLPRLPEGDERPATLSPSSNTGPLPLPTVPTGETILIVEDEAPLRMLVRRLLEKQGYHVIEAASGRRALEFPDADVTAASLLITDLVMPEGLSGWETAEQLRARNPKLRVLYTSGYDAHTAGQNVTMAPGSGFLQKPWQCADLTAHVRAILDS